MKHSERLHGIWVPVVTPFRENGELDIPSFIRLLERLVDCGIDGIVVNGTTGEGPTVSVAEWTSLMAEALRLLKPRGLPLMVGTGTNDTRETIRRTELAARHGADYALVVVPYYSKPSQEGICEHYRAVAASGVPVIAYDNPSRTGVGMTLQTARNVLELEGVAGLKDSSGSRDLVESLSASSAKPLLCGHDEDLLGRLRCGAQGGIVASAHLEPERYVSIYRDVMNGHLNDVESSFDRLLPLIRLLFREPSPAPLKWLLARFGLIDSPAVRLPLTPISRELERELSAYA